MVWSLREELKTSYLIQAIFCVSQGPAIGYPYEMLEINLHACT